MKKIILAVLTALLLLTTVSSAMTVKNGSAVLGIKNTRQETLLGRFITAMYHDGKLQKVQLGEPLNVKPGELVYQVFPFEDYESGSEVSSFLWDSVEGMTPLGLNKITFTSADIDNTNYTGDYILAVNTSATKASNTGTLPAVNISQSYNLLSAPDTDEPHKIHIEPVLYTPTSISPGKMRTSTKAEEYNVGDLKSFTVNEKYTRYNNKYSLEFICKAKNDKCYVWVANKEIDMDGHTPEKEDGSPLTSLDIVTDEIAENIAAEYDTKICPLLTQYFGSTNDHDGDTKISILFYDIQDGYGVNGNMGYTGGYFTNSDLYSSDKYSWASGNLTDMVHIDTYPQMIAEEGVNEAYSTIVHELQHFVNYSYAEYKVSIDKNYIKNWTPFNEAMSMAAEHIYQGPLSSRIALYNGGSTIYSLPIKNGKGFISWDGSLASYSLSYLFGQYLRTQTQGFVGGGNSIYRSILTGLPSYDLTGITAQVNKVMYGNAADKYMTVNDMIMNFRLALILRDDFGPFGFRGSFDSLNLPLYSGGDATLEPGGAVLIKNDGNFTPTVSNTPVKFFGITLPR